MNNTHRMLLLFFLPVLIAGCVSGPHKGYEGPEKSSQELATIEWAYSASNGYDGIVIRKVDSIELQRFTNSKSVNVLPGSHDLEVICRDAKYRELTDGKISISVDPGNIYVLRGQHKMTTGVSETGRVMPIVLDHSCSAEVRVYRKR